MAQKEIHSQVLKILGSSAPKEAQPWITMSALHSSFIQVRSGRASAAALQAYLSASLQSVASAYFLIGDCFLDEDNLKKLQTDRMNDGRSKTQQRRARLAEREKAKKAGLPLPSLADPEPVSLFDSEKVMLSHIKHLWQNSGEGWKKVVKASLTILHDQEFRPEEKDLRYIREELRTFKASVERSAYLFPSLTTQDLSREVADNVSRLTSFPSSLTRYHHIYALEFSPPFLSLRFSDSSGSRSSLRNSREEVVSGSEECSL